MYNISQTVSNLAQIFINRVLSSTIHQVLSPSCLHWSSPSSGWRPPTQSTDPRPVPPGIASGGKTGRKGRKRASTGERGPSYQDLYESLKSKYCV